MSWNAGEQVAYRGMKSLLAGTVTYDESTDAALITDDVFALTLMSLNLWSVDKMTREDRDDLSEILRYVTNYPLWNKEIIGLLSSLNILKRLRYRVVGCYQRQLITTYVDIPLTEDKRILVTTVSRDAEVRRRSTSSRQKGIVQADTKRVFAFEDVEDSLRTDRHLTIQEKTKARWLIHVKITDALDEGPRGYFVKSSVL